MNEKPIVGITMGDPAGNGPEITVKALAHEELYDRCRPIVVGDAKMIDRQPVLSAVLISGSIAARRWRTHCLLREPLMYFIWS